MTLLPQMQRFWHCSHEVWIDPCGGVDVDRPWYKKIVNDVRGLRAEFAARRGDVLVGDHSAALYVKTIDSIVL